MESMEIGTPKPDIESLKSEYFRKRKQWFKITDGFSKSVASGTLPTHESDDYKHNDEEFNKLNIEVVDLTKKLEDAGVDMDTLEAEIQQERREGR